MRSERPSHPFETQFPENIIKSFQQSEEVEGQFALSALQPGQQLLVFTRVHLWVLERVNMDDNVVTIRQGGYLWGRNYIFRISETQETYGLGTTIQVRAIVSGKKSLIQ